MLFAGGLAAVIYMETLQACLVVVGATVLTVLSKSPIRLTVMLIVAS